MTPTHPLAVRYLDKLSQALGDFVPVERAEILNEIGNHISDAMTAGTPIEEVLTTLGPAENLARGYRVELLLNPKTPSPRSDRWLRIIGLLTLGSIPTLVIVVTLGAIGVSFAASGVAVFGAGIIAASGGVPSWIKLGMAPWAAIALGPPLTGLGIAALWALKAYLRFLVRAVRRVVPGRQPA